MLNQLIEQLAETISVGNKFSELEEKATTIPKTAKDILELVRLVRYEINQEEFPTIKHDEVLMELSNCRQILINSDEYFYI